jgi:hypothetical protein
MRLTFFFKLCAFVVQPGSPMALAALLLSGRRERTA